MGKNGNFSAVLPQNCSFIHCFQVELEFENTGFCEGRKTKVRREKPLGAGMRTTNKLNPHNI